MLTRRGAPLCTHPVVVVVMLLLLLSSVFFFPPFFFSVQFFFSPPSPQPLERITPDDVAGSLGRRQLPRVCFVLLLLCGYRTRQRALRSRSGRRGGSRQMRGTEGARQQPRILRSHRVLKLKRRRLTEGLEALRPRLWRIVTDTSTQSTSLEPG